MVDRIDINMIPHAAQRYDTVGDYWVDMHGDHHIRVSEMSDWRFEILVVIHELVEMVLCRHAGIDFAKIDEFDKAYEAKRQDGDVSEPGDDPAAPYHKQHILAGIIERTVAFFLDVDWSLYEKEVEEL